MNLAEQKRRFYAEVFPARPNSWEVDEIFDQLAELEEDTAEAVLMHVGAIWPISHSLCFGYLGYAVQALSAQLLSTDMLGEWVRQILGLYEKKGLLGARQYMADVDKFFLGPLRGEAGVRFAEISTRMVHYVRGISGRTFEFAEGKLPSTDTQKMYFPDSIEIFSSLDDNILLYKLMICLQWGHVESKIFAEILQEGGDPGEFLAGYPDRQLAVDLFSILQFIRSFRFLEMELPGLIRQGRSLCSRIIDRMRPGENALGKCQALQALLKAGTAGQQLRDDTTLAELFGETGAEVLEMEVLAGLPRIYAVISSLSGSYRLGPVALLLGMFDFVRAGEAIRQQRAADKAQFVGMLAAMLEQQGRQNNESGDDGNTAGKIRQSLLVAAEGKKSETVRRDAIVLDNEGKEIPEELAELIRSITDDLGELPEAYVQAAAGQAGRGVNRQQVIEPAAVTNGVPLTNAHSYDEWDYRRAGYRTAWCLLTEKTLPPVRSGFVRGTLTKYQPQLLRLRRQFEMLRTRHRYVGRRRQGDEIDLDAHIEALCDARAGLTPSDRLFVQLLKDERDIAAMFLVDMSNSTQGWVGVAIKEALVLLAESLEVVGDRYAIYGFSGMRRSRSEIFHIKHLDEIYGEEVQRRISAIGPKEYTRMGPPIRHLTQKLQESQSAVRLLVVISDGKPEDYDDYKGQYAIEDTRKALLEARGVGVNPFCITIDKSAHDYLAHMFGRGNYIFVDKVLSLPAKMAELYRLLTS